MARKKSDTSETVLVSDKSRELESEASKPVLTPTPKIRCKCLANIRCGYDKYHRPGDILELPKYEFMVLKKQNAVERIEEV